MAVESSPDSQRGESCPTILLDDAPALSDSFTTSDRIGPHSRVAAAIAELVHSGASGKLVSIEGTWGSGKSTVISLLSTLVSEKQTVLFSFDAWAHTGDPLRVEFLKSLASALRDAKWIDSRSWKEWKKRLGILSGQRRVSAINTKSIPSVFGIFFALSLFLVPIGISLMQADVEDGVVLAGDRPAWMFLAGSGVALLPVFVALFQWAVNGRKRLSFLTGREEKVRSSERSSPEATSVEFEKSFRWLTKLALKNHASRRLVVVIDNLDRVSEADLATIWTTLQAFTRLGSSVGDSFGRRHWVIVPFDPKEISKIWQGLQTSETTKESHLLDKTFHARFRLGLPLPSDWRSYLGSALAEALPEHNADEFGVVSQIYNMMMTNGQTSPREIRAFVNQIGSVHRQWQDHEFSLAEIAYFVLLSRSEKDVAQAILQKTSSREQIERLFGIDLSESLAALAYNVERKRGFEVLIADPAYEYLARGELESFEKLFGSHPSGFWAALPRFIHRIETSGDEFSTVLQNLARSTPVGEGGLEAQPLLAAVQIKTRTVHEWASPGEELGSALATIATKVPTIQKQITSSVANSISPKSLTPSSLQNDGELMGLRMAIRYGDTLVALGQEAPVFRHGTTPTRWLANIETIDQMAPSATASFLENALPLNDLLRHLSALLRPGVAFDVSRALKYLDLSGADLRELRSGMTLGLTGESDPLFVSISLKVYLYLLSGHLLEQDDEQSALEYRSLLQVWAEVPKYPAIVRSIAFVAALANPKTQFREQPSSGLVARFQTQINEFLASPDPGAAGEVSALLITFRQSEAFFAFVIQRGKLEPLSESVLSILLASEDVEPAATLDFIFDAWMLGLNSIVRSSGVLVRYDDDEIASKIEKQEFRVSNIDLYADLTSTLARPKTIEVIRRQLQQRTLKQWREILPDEGAINSTFNVLLALQSSNSEGAALMADSVVTALKAFESRELINRFWAFLSERQRLELKVL